MAKDRFQEDEDLEMTEEQGPQSPELLAAFRAPPKPQSSNIKQLVETLAHNAEDIGYTETIRPVSEEEEVETSSFIPLPSLPFGKHNGVLDLEELGLLGEGGMGQVKLVRQHTLRRDVAVKQLKPSKKNSQSMHRLLEEARRTGLLEHPNIIPIHSVGLDEEGLPAIVMKRVEGISWRTLIYEDEHPSWKSYPDRLGRHIEITIQVCNALQFAHSRGIYHRDVKPDNVMLGDFGEVHLLDWGLSFKPAEDQVSKGVVGTLAYMAPEMLKGSGSICPQTDVYLLAASLHEALTKAPRHQGSTLMEVASSVSLSRPALYYDDVPLELSAICNKAMHAEPKERYESALAFREALAGFLRHRSSLELSDNARDQLKEAQELLDKNDAKKLYKLLTEIRFGFEQSLRLWEENRPAKDGLASCLRLMFEHEIAQRNVNAAELILSELHGENPKLKEKLAILKKQLQAEQEEQQRLEEMRSQMDLSVSGRQRLLFALSMTAFLVMIAISLLVMRSRSMNAVAEYPVHILAAVIAFLFLSLLTFFNRGSLLKNDISRRMIYAFLWGTGAVPVIRTQGMLLQIPLSSFVPLELLLLGTSMAVLGASLQKSLFIPASIWLSCALLSTVFSHYWLEFWTVSYVSCMLSVAYVWRRSTS